MSLRHVILGLVVEQPRHGYALQAALEQCFGELCDPGPGEVYRVLAALSRAGLVSASTVRIGRRPRRKVYAPTAAGRRALTAWLRDDVPAAPRPGREELWLRLLVAARVAPALLAGLLDGQVESGRRAVRALEEARPELERPVELLPLVLTLRHASALAVARQTLHTAELCRDVVTRYRSGAAVAELVERATGDDAARAARTTRSGATG
ncbi:PadR family transcriptional regulator [Candidatus Binatia bacterium]|nr:PadR family transcriptional regulator [Candidatus Binatia bacterium]